MEERDLWVGDQLPTIYEAALTIFHYAPGVGSQKRKAIVHKYAVAVRNIWVQSFTEDHVIHLNTVKLRIDNIMKDYDYKVGYHRHSASKSIRRRNREWMHMDVPQPKTKKAAWCYGCKNSSLFDIVKNAETTTDKDGNVIEGLTGREKIFYDDQKGARRHLLSQEIDEEYEEEQLAIQQAIIEADAERQAD